MRKPTTFSLAPALGMTAMVFTAVPSLAFPITYTEQATASGSLNGVAFTDKTVLLTMTNDTTNVINPLTGIFENVSERADKSNSKRRRCRRSDVYQFNSGLRQPNPVSGQRRLCRFNALPRYTRYR